MKYVKCVNPLAVNLTYQKVYEVKHYWTSDWSNLTYIILINEYIAKYKAKERDKKLESIGI